MLGPRAIDLKEAQAEVNFVVVEPRRLPSGCTIVSTSLRPEQPPGRPEGSEASEFAQTPWSDANPCSLRTVIAGQGRELRVKQFLYDWAPPAAGIAPLWDSPSLEAFACGDMVGWIGEDYREALGACVEHFDTQVELSVLAGTFSHGELTEIVQSLAEADPAGADAVRATPFHRRNYWVRHRKRPYGTPHGLWRDHAKRPYQHTAGEAVAGHVPRSRSRVLLPPAGFAVESAVALDGDGRTEVELILRNREVEAERLWLVCAAAGSDDAPPVPPVLDDHAAEVAELCRAGDREAWVAATTRRWGAWEAVWSEEGATYALWASPTTTWDEQRFVSFVAGLVPAT